MKGSSRVLLLDRDGVLNHDRPDYIQTVAQLRLISGVGEAMRRLREAGVATLVVTNQACVGKGLVTPATLEAIHARLAAEIAEAGGEITQFYLCAHRNEDRCACRKPAPGLILRAQQEWGFDPSQTWMVGDAERDIQAAEAAGCRAALVRTGKGEITVLRRPDVPAFADLPAFVENFLQNG
ncbi:MAG: HAD-IIIA family hydrolase [Magnetococcales bacterium]|nr:HAD-IIIA family hydrolase [Magnetococcales bacterium]